MLFVESYYRKLEHTPRDGCGPTWRRKHTIIKIQFWALKLYVVLVAPSCQLTRYPPSNPKCHMHESKPPTHMIVKHAYFIESNWVARSNHNFPSKARSPIPLWQLSAALHTAQEYEEEKLGQILNLSLSDWRAAFHGSHPIISTVAENSTRGGTH